MQGPTCLPRLPSSAGPPLVGGCAPDSKGPVPEVSGGGWGVGSHLCECEACGEGIKGSPLSLVIS